MNNQPIFEQLAELYKLKSITRDTIVDNRNESTAEHTWSMFVLADYFIETYSYNLDRIKVYQMITYHDLAEVKLGDIPLIDHEARKNKKELEDKALKEVLEEVPKHFGDFIHSIVHEYEERKSAEARFVKAIDFIDADITCLSYDYKYKENGYTKEFLLMKKNEKINTFPEIIEFYTELLDYLESEKYFN